MATAPKKRRRRRPRPTDSRREDSWGLVLRDLGVLMAFAGAIVAAGLWFVGWLPGGPATAPPPVAAKPSAPPAHRTAAPAPPKARAKPTAPPPARPEARAKPSAPPPARPKPAPVAARPSAAPVSRRGVRHMAMVVSGVPVQVVTVDLRDPAVVATIALANNATRPNAAGATLGDEPFEAIVKRTRAAAAINGTFFSTDGEKRVMGNMVRDGALIKFSRWERGGTTFWLGPGNRPSLVTGEPAPWQACWLALTGGPRLLRDGQTWCKPLDEGFHDPHVMKDASRSALGFDRAGERLWLVSFDAKVALTRAAEVMRAIGCHEAMNLDGGDSRGLAVRGRVLVKPHRRLTNVLTIYDGEFRAPSALSRAFATYRPAAAD